MLNEIYVHVLSAYASTRSCTIECERSKSVNLCWSVAALCCLFIWYIVNKSLLYFRAHPVLRKRRQSLKRVNVPERDVASRNIGDDVARRRFKSNVVVPF